MTESPDRFFGGDAYGQGPDAMLNEMNVAANSRATPIADIQGSVIGSLDAASGALFKAGYLPFGENTSTTTGRFRFTGRRLDANTASGAQPSGLYYYRARVYAPDLGRFLQPDPIGYAGGLNVYGYVGNDPLNFVDPSGLFCTSSGGNLSCTSPGGVSFVVPAPPGAPSSLNAGDSNYHNYNIQVNAGSISPSRLMGGVINSPTPGSPQPATVAGTANDATPSMAAAALNGVTMAATGQPLSGPISPVISYATTDQNGNPIVVNVTQSGHPLDFGYVVRYATTNNGKTTLNNEGEGNGLLQSPSSPVGGLINNQWQGQSQGIIQKLK